MISRITVVKAANFNVVIKASKSEFKHVIVNLLQRSQN